MRLVVLLVVGRLATDAQKACLRGAARAGTAPPPMDLETLWGVLARGAACVAAPRAAAAALNCLHRLIAYGALEGAVASSAHAAAEGASESSEGALEQAVRLACAAAEQGEDLVDLQVVKLLLTAVSMPHGAVRGEALLLAVRTCYNIVLVSEDVNIQTTGTATLQQMLGAVMQRCAFEAASRAAEAEEEAEAEEAAAAEAAEHDNRDEGGDEGDGGVPQRRKKSLGGAPVLSPSERDALVVFRALCKLSLRDRIADGSPEQALLNKRLSLELVRHMYDRGGAAFRLSAAQAASVREALCMAILRNSVAAPPKVASLAAGLLASVYVNARHLMKTEIGVMIPAVVLAPLEAAAGPAAGAGGAALGGTANAGAAGGMQEGGAAARAGMLEAAAGPGSRDSAANASAAVGFVLLAAKSSQALVDLFINYDMEVSAGAALFERLARAVCALATAAMVQPQGQAASGVQRAAATAACALAARLGEWAGNRGGGEVFAGGEAQEAAAEATAGGDVEYEAVRSAKATLSSGLALFNKKPAKGIKALLSAGHISVEGEDEAVIASAVAAFLSRADSLGLSKTAVGEYLGSEEPAAIAALKVYLASIDFAGQHIDEAIRRALEGFRLPGEAQKIDRIMEALAPAFLADNPGAFKSADTAYVLCYSIMMLHTDAHNPGVDKKMTKDEFRANNTGISEVEEVPVEMLDGIYDRIVAKEIKLQGDDFTWDAKGGANEGQKQLGGWAAALASLGRGRSKAEAAAEAAQAAVACEMASMARVRAAGQGFVAARGASLARPMLQAVGRDLLRALAANCNGAVFTAKLLGEEVPGGREAAQASANGNGSLPPPPVPPGGDAPAAAARALAALARAACAVGEVQVRDGAVVALRRAATLGLPAAMRPKVSAVAAFEIAALASSMGAGLGEDAWVVALETLSRAEALAFEEGGAEDALVARGVLEARGCPNLAPGFAVSEAAREAREARESVDASSPRSRSLLLSPQAGTPRARASGRAQAQALWSCRSENARHCLDELRASWGGEPGALAGRVWASAEQLDGDALVALALALCVVSARELAAPRAPRLFLLQGLVEVGHYAASATGRFVWGRVWGAVAALCVKAGCRAEEAVALRAVDALRLLASRVLGRLGDGSEAADGSPGSPGATGSFALQNEVLRPFAAITRRARSPMARGLAATAAARLACGGGPEGRPLSSGWRSVFAALAASAADADAGAVQAGQAALEFVTENGLFDSGLLFGEDSEALFADCVGCVAAFAVAPAADGSGAFEAFGRVAGELAASATGSETDQGRWSSLFDALLSAANTSEGTRRREALAALLGLLTQHEGALGDGLWSGAYAALVAPLFTVAEQRGSGPMAETIEVALPRLVGLVAASAAARGALAAETAALLGRLLRGAWGGSTQDAVAEQLKALLCALAAASADEGLWVAVASVLESATEALALRAPSSVCVEGVEGDGVEGAGWPLSPDSALAEIAAGAQAPLFPADDTLHRALPEAAAEAEAPGKPPPPVLLAAGSLRLARALAAALAECAESMPVSASGRLRELLGRLARDAAAFEAGAVGADKALVALMTAQEAEAGGMYMRMLVAEMDAEGTAAAAAEDAFVAFASAALRTHRSGPCGAAAAALCAAARPGGVLGGVDGGSGDAGARAWAALYAPLCGAIGGCADPKARAVIAEALEAAIGPALATS